MLPIKLYTYVNIDHLYPACQRQNRMKFFYSHACAT